MSTKKQPDTAAQSGSTKIFAKLEEMEKELADVKATISLATAEIMKKLDELSLKISTTGGGRAARSTGGAKGGSSSGNSSAKKRFPSNSLAWFKEEYKAHPEETMKLFFDDEVFNIVKKHMETDEKDKLKEGEARTTAEITYLWQKFVISNEAMKKKIKAFYDERKKESDEANKTPAGKETNDSDPGDD